MDHPIISTANQCRPPNRNLVKTSKRLVSDAHVAAIVWMREETLPGWSHRESTNINRTIQ